MRARHAPSTGTKTPPPPPPALCRHAEMCRTGVKWGNLWQTPSCWANGQTNKLDAPLFSSTPPSSLTPLTLQAIWRWLWQFHRRRSGGVLGLLSLTWFRLFDSRLAIQASLPLICKYQHAAPEPRFVFLALLVLLSVPAGYWSYKCLDRETLHWAKSLSLSAKTAVFTHAADHKPPIHRAHFLSVLCWVPSCFLSWMQEEEGEHL